MNIEENESIDQSQWLPKGTPILTPERSAMLGMTVEHDADGEVKYAEIKVVNLMRFLFEKRILDDQQLYDGSTYQVWRGQATKHFRNEIIPYDPLDNPSNEESFGEYGFILLSQRMQRHDCEIIAHAIDTDSTQIAQRMRMLLQTDPHSHMMAHRSLRNTYERSFVRLVEIMPGVREIIAAMKKNKTVQVTA